MRTKETYPDKEVDHEENIESKINLLGSVHCPRYTCFNSVTENRKINKKVCFCTKVAQKLFKELLFKVCLSKVELIATLPGSINEIDNKT